MVAFHFPQRNNVSRKCAMPRQSARLDKALWESEKRTISVACKRKRRRNLLLDSNAGFDAVLTSISALLFLVRRKLPLPSDTQGTFKVQ